MATVGFKGLRARGWSKVCGLKWYWRWFTRWRFQPCFSSLWFLWNAQLVSLSVSLLRNGCVIVSPNQQHQHVKYWWVGNTHSDTSFTTFADTRICLLAYLLAVMIDSCWSSNNKDKRQLLTLTGKDSLRGGLIPTFPPRPKLLLVTSRKSHVSFRLTPRSMTLKCKVKSCRNFARFRDFGRQQRLKEWR